MAPNGAEIPETARKVPEKFRTRWASLVLGCVVGAIAAGPATAEGSAVHYAPAEDLEAIDVAQLAAARRRVDMAAYVLTDRHVIEALTAAARRGVAVRVYLDGEQAGRADMTVGHPFATLLRTPGVTVKNKKTDAPLMHLKSYCVDGTVLRTGAANFSLSGLTKQDNDLVLLGGPGVCAGFDAAFGRIWSGPDAE